ncbi:Coiled-coil domain-containing protein 77 [Frankliniella fusca]|uniref:Coiled-coil domain-containing protein 77 n=1 Tax=Frankliniella fusca TaxID=407009 RepID=A0AAE1HRH5_9NEOP|nr:Coiled-coil domain-containing protein 77 [Frankliniella fusca]
MSNKKMKHKRIFSDLSSATDHQMRQLPMSKELISHYLAKFSSLNRDYEELTSRVEDCRALFDADCRLQQELVQRNNEVSRLQQAVSDLQVYVFEEREQALRLYAENDKLKLRELEDRKKIDLLLSLSGITEDEVTFFLSEASKKSAIVPQRLSRKNLKKNESKVDRNKENKKSGHSMMESETEYLDVDILKLKVQALQAQLSEQIRLHRDETAALLQDRELARAERIAEQTRHEQLFEALTARLQKSQSQVCDLTAALVQCKKDYHGNEENWTLERDRLIKNLDLCKEQLGEVSAHDATVIPGGGMRSARSCGELSVLKGQLSERDRMLAMYQEQTSIMEQEVARLRDQAESSKNQFKTRVQKMAAQVSYLRNKYNELDRRRMLEAEGFRSDIRLMRSRLRDLERGFSRLNAKPGRVGSSSKSIATESLSVNTGLVSNAQETVERARQLEQELKLIHSRVLSLESELKSNGENE